MKPVERAKVIAIVTGAVALVAACSGVDTGTSGSSGTSGTTGDSGTSGTSGTSGDSGADAADSAEGGGGGKKANGAACAGNGDCVSGHCQSQGGGMGAASGSFCTIACATPQQDPAPECAAAIYTGKCSGKGFCQVK